MRDTATSTVSVNRGTSMPSFAVVRSDVPRTVKAILLILDDRAEAEEIAIELRRKDFNVEVVELAARPDPPDGEPDE